MWLYILVGTRWCVCVCVCVYVALFGIIISVISVINYLINCENWRTVLEPDRLQMAIYNMWHALCMLYN